MSKNILAFCDNFTLIHNWYCRHMQFWHSHKLKKSLSPSCLPINQISVGLYFLCDRLAHRHPLPPLPLRMRTKKNAARAQGPPYFAVGPTRPTISRTHWGRSGRQGWPFGRTAIVLGGQGFVYMCLIKVCILLVPLLAGCWVRLSKVFWGLVSASQLGDI